MSEYLQHITVLKERSVEELVQNRTTPPQRFVDLTFGGGGHSLHILETTNVFLHATDQDEEAYANGLKRIEKYKDRVDFQKINFEQFPEYFEKNFPTKRLDGVLMDLGVSSHHFDADNRGFSFRKDGPLDMRMNKSATLTAELIVNEYDEEDLANLIYKYGEEGFSRQIAKNICLEREQKRITSTTELEEIVFHSYPAAMRKQRLHPATKTFQALRIAVNDELGVLERVLPKLISLLDEGGRIAVITFHSLEDRIVKHIFKDSTEGKKVHKKPVQPTTEEIELNGRARSAKLRVFERRTNVKKNSFS